MADKKLDIIFTLTDEVHEDVTEIYELIMDGETDPAIVRIDKTIGKLRHLKSNIVTKEN